ncbi:hypothetical protein [Methylobacterium sp. J-090]|nr:hypothetical protein [Methylobacterium sp. J-090]
MFASRFPAHEPLGPSGAAPVRMADLAVCALLAIVTVGLLVSAI